MIAGHSDSDSARSFLRLPFSSFPAPSIPFVVPRLLTLDSRSFALAHSFLSLRNSNTFFSHFRVLVISSPSTQHTLLTSIRCSSINQYANQFGYLSSSSFASVSSSLPLIRTQHPSNQSICLCVVLFFLLDSICFIIYCITLELDFLSSPASCPDLCRFSNTLFLIVRFCHPSLHPFFFGLVPRSTSLTFLTCSARFLFFILFLYLFRFVALLSCFVFSSFPISLSFAHTKLFFSSQHHHSHLHSHLIAHMLPSSYSCSPFWQSFGHSVICFLPLSLSLSSFASASFTNPFHFYFSLNLLVLLLIHHLRLVIHVPCRLRFFLAHPFPSFTLLAFIIAFLGSLIRLAFAQSCPAFPLNLVYRMPFTSSSSLINSS